MNKLYEKLAQQLAEEQAELKKREAMVEGMKKMLRDKKLEVIEKKVTGKMYRFDNKKYVVLNVSGEDLDEGMRVKVCFGEAPDVHLQNAELTQKERLLLTKYQEAFNHCRWNRDKGVSDLALRTATALCRYKHHLDLLNRLVWTFDYDEFVRPGFFQYSGLTMTDNTRMDGSKLLEELVYFQR